MSSPLPPPPNDRPGHQPHQPQPHQQPVQGWTQPAPPFGQQPPSAPYGTMPIMAPYGQQPPASKTSGMAVAGFVLALVGLLPCFWFWFQIPGLLGLIFSIVGLKATSAQAKKGRGLAIAGTVVSSIAIAIAVLFTLYVYTSDDCVTNGLEVNCQFDSN